MLMELGFRVEGYRLWEASGFRGRCGGSEIRCKGVGV